MHLRYLVLFAFLLVACNESHLTMTTSDAGPLPQGDAYVAPSGHDSGFYVWPDSGPAVTDAYVAPDSATVAPPTGGVTVVCDTDTAPRETVTGARGYDFYHFHVIPGDRPVYFLGVQMTVTTIGFYGDVVGSASGSPYFTNWQLTADGPYRVFNLPDFVTIRPAVDRRLIVTIGNHYAAGTITDDTVISVRADVAATEEGRNNLTLGQYTTELAAAGFQYADTHEDILDINWVGCDHVTLPQTTVRLSDADITVDRVFEDPSATVTSGAGNTVLLRLAALNDGAMDGTLDRIVFDTRAVVIPASGSERPASILDAFDSCRLSAAGIVTAIGRFEGEQIVFDHAAVPVNVDDRGTSTADFSYFNLECHVHLNDAILPLYGALRVWASVNAFDGFTLIQTAPARVWGTLSLEQNTLPEIAAAGGSRYLQIVR